MSTSSGLVSLRALAAPGYCATKAGLPVSRSHCAIIYAIPSHVIEALPPVVDTAMTRGRVNGKKMSPKECAAEIVDAIATNAPEANVGMVKLLRLAYSISPALARRIMIKY